MNTKEKAAQAKVILDNEVFKEVVSNLEISIIEQWKYSDNQDDREFYWYKSLALRSIIEDLESLIHNNVIEGDRNE
jgi:hypothetical protein